MSIFPGVAKAVSYTHLDVYKRQVLLGHSELTFFADAGGREVFEGWVLAGHWKLRRNILPHKVGYSYSKWSLFASQVLEQGVKVFELGVLDDDFAAAVVVIDGDFEAERALQAILDFADVGIDGRFWRCV